MASKDPAFLFYPSDFLTGTMFMTNEQIGIYVRLLCSQHQHGGMIDKLSFNSLVKEDSLIRSKFIETDIGFFNQRLADEMQLRCKKSTNISEAVKKVWEKRKEGNGIPLESQKNPNAILMRPEDVNINRDINEKNIKFNSKKYLTDIGFDEKLVDDWLLVRKNKKATNTKTAFDRFHDEVKKTRMDKNIVLRTCVEKSWSGFKAEWINETTFNKQPPKVVLSGIV